MFTFNLLQNSLILLLDLGYFSLQHLHLRLGHLFVLTLVKLCLLIEVLHLLLQLPYLLLCPLLVHRQLVVQLILSHLFIFNLSVKIRYLHIQLLYVSLSTFHHILKRRVQVFFELIELLLVESLVSRELEAQALNL